jgi:hypothetical protein
MRIRDAYAEIGHEILRNVWQNVEYWFVAARANRGARIELS